MVKGRNTTVVSIRIPDKTVVQLKERAVGIHKELSVGDYIKGLIIKDLLD